jgi:D-alanyl-D-alanine carboxypeptidase (penicillin-binding protein 5/6)
VPARLTHGAACGAVVRTRRLRLRVRLKRPVDAEGFLVAAVIAAVAVALVVAAPALAGPPPVSARAYYVQNGATGEVLAARAPARRVPIASITKLMTVLVTLDHEGLSHLVTVAPGAASVGESSIHLRAGERLSVRDLLEAALIQSANDAADALAYDVGRGDEGRFVALMNARARALGLRNTHFARPDGLDAVGHYSSAKDVTLLARVAMQRAEVRSIVRERTETIAGGRVLHTWNDLLGTFPGLIGVKTGHTAGAGWCEVGAVRGRGFTIYATVLGSPTRTQRNRDLAALLRWGVSRYRTVAVVSRRVYARAALGYGRDALALVPRRPLVRAVRVDRPLTARVVAPSVVRLPVRKGERLGVVKVYEGRKLLGARPLVAARSVSKPGLAGRVGWFAGRTVHHFLGFFT